ISSLLAPSPSESGLALPLFALAGVALVAPLVFEAAPSPASAVIAAGLAAPSPSASAAGALVEAESVAFLTAAASLFFSGAVSASGARAWDGARRINAKRPPTQSNDTRTRKEMNPDIRFLVAQICNPCHVRRGEYR